MACWMLPAGALRLAFRITRSGDGGSEAAMELQGAELNQFLEVLLRPFLWISYDFLLWDFFGEVLSI